MNTSIEHVMDATIRRTAMERPLGCFVVFTQQGDPHSPVMRPRYDQLVAHAENQIPLIYIDTEDVDPAFPDRWLVYSVPTLLWVTNDCKTVLRIVGTTNERKLIQEFDQILDLVLGD